MLGNQSFNKLKGQVTRDLFAWYSHNDFDRLLEQIDIKKVDWTGLYVGHKNLLHYTIIQAANNKANNENYSNNRLFTAMLRSPYATPSILNRGQGDGDGDTPLHIAIRGDLLNMARLLIEKGADLNKVNAKGLKPSALCRSADMSMTLNQVKNRKKSNDLEELCETFSLFGYMGEEDLITELLTLIEQGYDFTHSCIRGVPVLHYCITQYAEAYHQRSERRASKYLEVFNAILSSKYTTPGFLNTIRDRWNEDTPLHLAAQFDLAGIASALFNKGANRFEMNRYGYKVYDMCANSYEVVKVLYTEEALRWDDGSKKGIEATIRWIKEQERQDMREKIYASNNRGVQ